MTVKIDLQVVSAEPGLPDREQFQRWSDAACTKCGCDSKSMTIRITDIEESAELNSRYRNRQGPTNVLSFPFENPPGVSTDILGDLVICAPVVVREAIEQDKTPEAHWAHILIHGVLHLCGYDHISPEQADIMETLETDIITGFGYPPPYELSVDEL